MRISDAREGDDVRIRWSDGSEEIVGIIAFSEWSNRVQLEDENGLLFEDLATRECWSTKEEV